MTLAETKVTAARQGLRGSGDGPDVSIWVLTACPTTERGRAPLFLEFLWRWSVRPCRPAGPASWPVPPPAGGHRWLGDLGLN